jgi:hypothetical protein
MHRHTDKEPDPASACRLPESGPVLPVAANDSRHAGDGACSADGEAATWAGT